MTTPHIEHESFLHPFAGMDAASCLRERAQAHPDKPFLIWAPLEGGARIWTWGAFEEDVARLAGGLRARGVSEGDRVFILLENCPQTLLARFACAWIGAVAVLGNPALAAPEVRDLVEATGARAAITQPRLYDMLAACPGLSFVAATPDDAGLAPAAPVPASARFETLFGPRAPARAPDPLQPALILFTTGTTARAKGVVWTHANLLWGAKMAATQQGVRSDDVYQIFLPLFHVVGFSWSFLGAFYAGATVVLQPRFSASRFWPVAMEHRATLASQVKFTSSVLGQSDPPAHAFRMWITANHTPAFAQRFGLRELTGWGMTEMVAQGIVGDPWSAQPARSIGRPSVGYRIHVEDDAGRPVRPGETGHLLVGGVRGLSVFRDYFNDARGTAEAFDAAGRFITGDRVTLLENGWLEFADRTKDVIKVGGEGVSGGEVEACILQVAGVREAAVVGAPDAIWGERVVAFVIAADAGAAPQALRAQVEAHCLASLAKFKRPAEIRVVEDVPRIGFGKIAKVKLRDALAAEQGTGA
jgi:crotonobetaine/carnitine-CoA ligase